jgi:hypothetical protein
MTVSKPSRNFWTRFKRLGAGTARKITLEDGTARHGIVWIADAPAHGARFCGYPNHQEEEPKLEPLIRQLASHKTTFRGFNLNGWATRTFSEMEKVYKAVKPPVSFRAVTFEQRAELFKTNVQALGQFITVTLTAEVREFLS